MNFYKITLTTSNGFEYADLKNFKEFFQNFSHAYLAVEHGQNGNAHIEGVIQRDTVSTNNVRLLLERAYLAMGLPVSCRSVVVRRVTHLNGAIFYASKELNTERGCLLILRGWSQTWIDEQLKAKVPLFKQLELKKLGHHLSKHTAAATVFKWCDAHNRCVTSKADFLEIVYSMASEGWMFGNIRSKALYPDVLALFSQGYAIRDIYENDLCFFK